MSGGVERLAEQHFPSEVSENASVWRSVMDHESTVVLIWLAAAISLLVLIQVGVLGALFLMLRRVRSTARQIEGKLRASGVDLYDLAGISYRLLGTLETATKKGAEIVESLEQGLTEIRPRLARIDQSISNRIAQIKRGSEALKHALADPVIRFRAIAAAISAALEAFRRRPQNGPREHNC
jgi:hypothetical protein